MSDAGVLCLTVFLTSYALFLTFPNQKWIVGMIASAVVIGTSFFEWNYAILEPMDALRNINYNVLLIFGFTLILADLFMESRVPEVMAGWITQHSSNAMVAMVLLCALSGFLSIAVENVATVLVIAPICFAVADKCKISPVPLLIGVSVSSNLQGAATLIGDPPSILLATHRYTTPEGVSIFNGMTFNDFFIYDGKPGMFFAVQIAAVVGLVVLWYLFRKERAALPEFEARKVITWVPTLCLTGMVVSLAVISALEIGGHLALGLTCAFWSIVATVWAFIDKKLPVRAVIQRYDWQTTIFLVAVFVLVAGMVQSGVVNSLADWGARNFGHSPLFAFIAVVVVSVAFSAFVDNVPYVAAMLPVVGILTSQMPGLVDNPTAIYFGLLIGASVGGNITPIGAAANIVTVGTLNKMGHHVSFWDFFKIGLPFTLASVLTGAVYVWLVFSP